MTQEEKAKAYDIALDKIKRLLGTGSNCSREDLEHVFPELMESEDERIRKWLIYYFKEVCDNVSEKEKKGVLAWLEKQAEQKPTEVRTTGYWNVQDVEQKTSWSEEDDNTLLDTIGILRSCGMCSTDRKLWLLSLKKRVQPQPKQEWSEDDKRMLIGLIDELSGLMDDATSLQASVYTKYLNWLKSLRPQSKWKPSEEMLEALYRAIPENVKEMSEDEMLLDKLYQGLKYGRVLK